MTREEAAKLRRQDMADFMEAWSQERARWPGGAVPGRMLTVTGLILFELERAGRIESDGNGNYRPTGY